MPFNQGGMNGGMNGGMTSGMFGPPGGPQNFDAVGIGSGGPTMTDQELQAMLGMLQSQSPTGPTLPIYDMPAQLPQGTPSLGTGIDPSMITGPPPPPPMDFGTQAITEGAGIGQDALMNMGIQELMEKKRLERLRAAGGGGSGGGGGFNSLRGGTGPTQIPRGMG